MPGTLKTIRLPSGDQEGLSTLRPGGVRRLAVSPFALATTSLERPFTNAIRVPSGDHEGLRPTSGPSRTTRPPIGSRRNSRYCPPNEPESRSLANTIQPLLAGVLGGDGPRSRNRNDGGKRQENGEPVHSSESRTSR